MTNNPSAISILLHNVRSAHNVGSLFRTADAVGVGHVYLTGYTPAPVDRFGSPRRDLAKVSLGAEKSVVWTRARDPQAVLRHLKAIGVQVVAVEQNARAVDYRTCRIRKPVVFVFGNEVRGLSPSLLKQADVIAEIPMRGSKESLNVSVAAGVSLFRMLECLG